MKINHRPGAPKWFQVPESDPVDDSYAAEVQRHTERGEREYRQAQERLGRAEKRLARVRCQKATPARGKLAARLQALITERRAEIAEYERMMTTPVVSADKQIRLRTGRDDHLELGEYKREPSPKPPAGPVIRSQLNRNPEEKP